MLIERQISAELRSLAGKYKVITITGPRQSGKTTLVKQVFPELKYVSMEETDNREFAANDPRAFISKYHEGVILDEIQRTPELLSYIQGMVDSKPDPAQFILTGSNQFSMLSSISQSLAGRTAILKLLPFSIGEINLYSDLFDTDDFLFRGFYPAIYANDLDPVRTYSYYFETYIEKDLRQLIRIKDLSLFTKFIRLCAGRIGSILNQSQLANETGVSVNTIDSWLSILEASFIIFRLPPWFDNISKRLIKSPKLYFYDTGIASFLLGIRSKDHLTSHPLRGNLFENMVVSEMIKVHFNRGLNHELYYFRDSSGNELDLVIPEGHMLHAAEIKSSATFHAGFLKTIQLFKKIYPERVKSSFLIYSGSTEQEVNATQVINFRKAGEIIHSLGN